MYYTPPQFYLINVRDFIVTFHMENSVDLEKPADQLASLDLRCFQKQNIISVGLATAC